MTEPLYAVNDRVWWHQLESGGERGERQLVIRRAGTIVGSRWSGKRGCYDYDIVPDDDLSYEETVQEPMLYALCLLDELAEIPE